MQTLPPGLQAHSTHTYGTLSLHISSLKGSSSANLSSFIPNFLGSPGFENMDTVNCPISFPLNKTIQYKIVTNLWMFYMYLSDMHELDICMLDNNGSGSSQRARARYRCILRLPLKSVKEVMNKQYNGDLLCYDQSGWQCDVKQGTTKIGTVTVKIWTQFDTKIHAQIKQLINLNELVIFEGISPIGSQTQLPRQPPLQASTVQSVPSTICQNVAHQHSINSEQYSLDQPSPIPKPYSHAQQQGDIEENDYRMLEEDIDKLIKEMQQKTYDCRRYQQRDQQNNKETTKDINKYDDAGDYQNSNKSKQKNNIGNRNSFNQTQKYGKSYGKLSDAQVHTQLGNSIMSKNTLPIPNSQSSLKSSHAHPHVNGSHSYSHSPPPRQPPMPQSQTTLNRPPSSNLLKSSSFPLYDAGPITHHSNSHLQLKLYQMLTNMASSMLPSSIPSLLQQCYTMKIYLNEDKQEYYAGQGVREGEVVVFNHNLKINNIGMLRQLKFMLVDDYGRVEAEGKFQMGRLFNSANRKGVFSVPLLSFTSNAHNGNMLKVKESKVEPVVPIYRSLRIQAQLVQQIQMVQVYLHIESPSVPVSTLRYKLPLTKQTIETHSLPHTNIFPHSTSPQLSDKIILQFWQQETNIGQCQLSLKNIKGTNYHVLNASMQPIYICDGKKNIRNMLEGDRVVGDVRLCVCFGNNKHIMAMLTQIKDNVKNIQKKDKVEVGYDQRMGVFVKNKVSKNQISVQVELQNQKNDHIKQQKDESGKFVELSFGDQSMISHTSHNQFLDNSMASFAKQGQQNHPSILQQDVPIVKTPPVLSSLPTLTSSLNTHIFPILNPLIQSLCTLRTLCKPHLLYNFISTSTLKQVLSQKLGISHYNIQMLFKLVLFDKQGMVNINILYDFINSMQIHDGKLEEKLYSDEMIVVGGLRLLYQAKERRNDRLLENGMEFSEMSQLFSNIGIKLTLHEFKILQKFMSNYKTTKSAEQLKKAVILQLDNERVQQMRECFYEQDILKQIYGDDSSSNHSGYSNYHNQSQPSNAIELPVANQCKMNTNNKQKPKFEKNDIIKQVANIKLEQKTEQKFMNTNTKMVEKVTKKYKIEISGIQSALESLECILEELPKNISIKLLIQYPVKLQLHYSINQRAKQFLLQENKGEVKDIDGKISLVSQQNVLAVAAFSLIKDVKSLYALKSQKGEFCGLINLMFQ